MSVCFAARHRSKNMTANFPRWLEAVAELRELPNAPATLKAAGAPAELSKLASPTKEKPRRNRKKEGAPMSTGFTVVARVTGGWRAPATIHAMTLDEARDRCKELCNQYPHQEFDILGVVAKSKRTSKVSLEHVAQPVPEPKRVKEPEPLREEFAANVMPLRGNG